MDIKSALIVFAAWCAATLFAAPLAADSTGGQDVPTLQAIAAAIRKVAFNPAPPAPAPTSLPGRIAANQDALIFSAAPRESSQASAEIYQPIAEYLSQVIGKKIVYQDPGTWGVYRTKMLQGSYDLLFDGPHFNSYRMEKLGHNVLVKIPERHEFAIIVRKDQTPFANVQQMAGRTFCTHAPPNLGTLVLLDQFDNPSRQPVIVSTNGWDNIYAGVASGKCVGGVLPVLNLSHLDRAGIMRIVYQSPAMPNQAFSAGPRISPEDQAKIAHALVSPQGAAATARLRAAYKVSDGFALANNQEYRGLAVYLRNEWGFY